MFKQMKILSVLGVVILSLSSCKNGIVTGESEPKVETHTVGGMTAQEIFFGQAGDAAVAACQGDLSELQNRVDRGLDPNTRGIDGMTLLMWAMSCDQLDSVRTLLENGADPNLKMTDLVERTAVPMAAGRTNPEYLKLILDYGGDPNATYSTGSRTTALRAAFELGLNGKGWENYYFLLDNGADVNLLHHGGTIAEFASAMRQFDKVLELLDRGYNVRIKRIAIALNSLDLPYLPEEQVEWAKKLRERYEEMGVQFPVTREDYINDK